MLNQHEILAELLGTENLGKKIRTILQKERLIFIFKGNPERSKIEGVVTLLIGLLFIYLPLIFTITFFRPYLELVWSNNFVALQKIYVTDFMGKDSIVKFYVPAFSFLFIFWLGFKIIRYGISCFFDPKQFFIGTENEFIVINGKKQQILQWFDFSEKFRILKHGTVLELELNSIKEIEDVIVHEVVKISGMNSAEELEAICRQRIKAATWKLYHDDDNGEDA